MKIGSRKSPMTLHQLIEIVSNRLKEGEVHCGHGTDNIRDESIALIFQVLQLPFDDQFEKRLQNLLTTDQIDRVTRVLEKRIKERKPLPYLVHEAYFAGLPFYVDERVIIPRSPIAELIEQAFEPWVDSNRVHAILDLCTGSGCIAVACAKVFPNAQIDAVDVSLEALEVAKINVERHGVSNRVTLIQSDLFEKLKSKKYDIIVSNPPYVSQEEWQILPPEYKYEPQLALVAEDFGLAFITRILQSASIHLTDHGILIVEVGDNQKALERKFLNIPFLWLAFERGGGEVFLLTKEQLQNLKFC